MIELTPEGRAWAQAHAADSIVANVALHGDDWPEPFRDAAAEVCNSLGTGQPAGPITITLPNPVGGTE